MHSCVAVPNSEIEESVAFPFPVTKEAFILLLSTCKLCVAMLECAVKEPPVLKMWRVGFPSSCQIH